jgi:hypothetical protein
MPRASGKFHVMAKLDNTHRAAVVRAWRDARAHGEDQASFCARQVPPIRPRTLRQWVRTFRPAMSQPEPSSNLQLVHAALADLRLLADLLERAWLDGSPRRDAAPPGEPREASGDEASEAITPGEPSGTPRAPEIARSMGASFWEDL